MKWFRRKQRIALTLIEEENSPKAEGNSPDCSCVGNRTDVMPLPNQLALFNLIRVIGKGSYGKVILVSCKTNKKPYAMKVMNKSAISNKKFAEKILTERNVMAHINHPYIGKLKMSFQTHRKLFMVLEFCPGGDLRYNLKMGKVDLKAAVQYTAEVALALDFLNKKFIIFRDLKADNILLDSQGHLKLTDFGLSRTNVCSWSNGASTICGTPYAIAPEVFYYRKYGFSCDWWSLGVLAYEMTAHEPPFQGTSTEEIYTKIIHAKVVLCPSWPASLVNFFSKIFIKHPDYRLGCQNGGAEVLSHEIFQSEPYGIDLVALSKQDVPAPFTPASIDPALAVLSTVSQADHRNGDRTLNKDVVDNIEIVHDESEFAPSNRHELSETALSVLCSRLNVDDNKLARKLGGLERLTDFQSIYLSNRGSEFHSLTVKEHVKETDQLEAEAMMSLTSKLPGYTYDGSDRCSLRVSMKA